MANDTRYDVFQHYGTAAQRAAFTPAPAAGIQPIYIWYESDTNLAYAYTTAWHLISSSTGNVTTGTTLTANALILGNGTSDVTKLGSLGTTTTLLHGNAAGAPSFGAVSLTADVTGILPVANGGTGVSSAFVPLLRATTTLTDAQVKALPTTAITLVAAPSSGSRIRPLALSLSVDTNAGAYTNINTTYADLHTLPTYGFYGVINDSTTDPALTVLSFMLGNAAKTVYDINFPNNVAVGSKVTISGSDVLLAGNLYVQNIGVPTHADVDAVALTLAADNNGSGNFTGGNAANTIKAITYYVIEAL